MHHDADADRLINAVAAIDVTTVSSLLSQGADPNGIRSPGGEDIIQPDRPLKMVVFRLSDCLLDESGWEGLATIAKMLLEYGADPVPAMQIAESRYGTYKGGEDERDDGQWKAWHIIAAAAGANLSRETNRDS